MIAIEEELAARERVGAGQSRPFQRRNEYKPPSTATTLVSGGSSDVRTPCCYCEQFHSPTDCTNVVQVDDRKQLLRRNGRCFSCLRKGHLVRDCRSNNRCRTCRGRHHTSICGSSATSGSNSRPSQQLPSHGATSTPVGETSTTPAFSASATTHSTLNPSAPTFNSPSTSTSLCADSNKVILLKTALAEVSDPRDSTRVKWVRIVLDSGSQKSYLTQQVKDSLSLPVVDQQRLSIAAFGSSRGRPKECKVVRLAVNTKSGARQLLELFVVPHICDPLTNQTTSICTEKYSHLAQLDLADLSPDGALEVDMLIGSDYYWEFVTGETIRGPEGPVAVGTTIGWVLSGPVEATGHHGSTVSLTTTHTLRVEGVTNMDLDNTLRSFWDLESLGIQAPSSDPVSDQFTSSIQRKEGRYEVSLPWREYHNPLPVNYHLCHKRLRGLLQRLKQEPDVLHEYDSIIRDQLEKGVVEVVENEGSTQAKVHYLPHHAVVRRDKTTTKVRVVYDASAKSNGPSLNDCLHTGPKFNQKILGILLRFRSYPTALIADIEKAFLMISISPRDRDVLRFLWVKDIHDEEPQLVEMRFTRVVFGVRSSPFLLNATMLHHINQYQDANPELVSMLTQSMYVDDVIFGADTEEDAYTLYANSKEMLGHGSFNLRKFKTNLPSLQKLIDMQEAAFVAKKSTSARSNSGVEETEETYVQSTLPANQQTSPNAQKVLGVSWDVAQDQLIFNLEGIIQTAQQLDPTKRNVISLIGQIYDPLGFLSPVTIRFKKLMQELCKVKLGWDQPLGGELLSKWKKLVSDLQPSPTMTLPRCYSTHPLGAETEYRLYGFCDASVAAYAAVVYLVAETNGQRSSSFVASKTRVAPLKTLTIPRLELLSSSLLARLISNVSEDLSSRVNLDEPRCYTDSQVTFYWIKGTGRDWKPFVQNRVQEIRKLVPVNCWSHCSGKENPADIPSRGLTPLELLVNKLWKNGPHWLRTEGEETALPEEIPEMCIPELRVAAPDAVHNLLTTQASTISQLINTERFSTLQKLYRTTAYALKFTRLLRKEATSPELIPADLAEAERLWVTEAQISMMEDSRFPKWREQFGLFRDDQQIWRCGGRLHNADLSFSAKHPMILPRKHALSALIVQGAHRRVQHNGVKETLTEVRAKFWIIGGRILARSTISKCVICRRHEGAPLKGLPAPPLPSFRVQEAPPFQYTAIDFAGPMYIHSKEGSSSNKVWICLFTCCVTRAVHLELVPDMTTTTFIRCLKRFAARRGLPRKIITDNAKTFKAASRLIQNIFKQTEVKEYFSHRGELRESHRHPRASGSTTDVEPGDIVLVHQQDVPRGFWKLALVERLITGRDGLARGALVRLPPKSGHPTLLQRPIQLLYPLEISSECRGNNRSNEDPTAHPEGAINDPTEEPRESPRTRVSASRARNRFKEWATMELQNSDSDSG